ncbi:hypothetical protein LX16_5263 [Stackebrandtia albiflava]|uniref:YGGT family protein n=1 Tax=Stackebrandtia albiflava TaxID=406432 RepID=A0A562ULR0_9ACTN|nr:hypothetical protein [Stackebrandtia albiflava]TWJ06526.1 hypothetical protein LX16_5263 [Stackebrandtia albiflava]
MPIIRTRYNPLAVRIVTGIFTAIVIIILLHLAFILLEANPGNPIVHFIAVLADWFAYLFKDMFTVDDGKLQAVFNYGLAALVYLLLGALIRGLFHRVD